MESRRLKYCNHKSLSKIPLTQITFPPSKPIPFPLAPITHS
ncbi:hypothetical protein JMUB7544_25760 [Staphylococcus aureus]